jgi:hypothetical protein
MPLTTAKLAHIDAVVRRAWSSRSQTVDLTLRSVGGGTTTKTVTAIWRAIQDADPSLGPAYGESAAQNGDADVEAVFFVADVTLAQLRSCIYAQLHAGQGQGAEPAHRYTLTTVEVKGMKPGGSRFLTYWIRQEP